MRSVPKPSLAALVVPLFKVYLDRCFLSAKMDAPSTAASSTSAEAAPPPAAANRSEMVEAARQFFMNPKVRATPFEEQRKFLREKGCTEAEMDEALDGISPVEVGLFAFKCVCKIRMQMRLQQLRKCVYHVQVRLQKSVLQLRL
jgi:hypothetical protein